MNQHSPSKKEDPTCLVTPQTPLLEWIAGGVGLLLTLGTFGVIGWEAVTTRGEPPPAIETSVEGVTAAAGGYVVEVRLRNRSHATAAAVEIEGEMSAGGGEPTRSTATIDYVPGESERRVGLFFREDPRRHGLEVRVLGYSEP